MTLLHRSTIGRHCEPSAVGPMPESHCTQTFGELHLEQFWIEQRTQALVSFSLWSAIHEVQLEAKSKLVSQVVQPEARVYRFKHDWHFEAML